LFLQEKEYTAETERPFNIYTDVMVMTSPSLIYHRQPNPPRSCLGNRPQEPSTMQWHACGEFTASRLSRRWASSIKHGVKITGWDPSREKYTASYFGQQLRYNFENTAQWRSHFATEMSDFTTWRSHCATARYFRNYTVSTR
jgi:hypothetical protein